MTRASSCCFARRALFLATLATVFLAAGPVRAQYPNPGMPSEPDSPVPGASAFRPRFAVDATLQLGELGKPFVRLDYRLSRAELLFERTPPAGYRAAYQVRVVFYTAKGRRQVTGDTYGRELRATSYAETRVLGDDILDHLDFQVAPGKYQIDVAVTDLVAERTSGTSVFFEVLAGPTGLIWFSDLTLGTVADRRAGPDSGRLELTPNPSRRYAENITQFAASGEIFDQRPVGGPDSTYRLSYTILSDAGESVLGRDTTLVRKGIRTLFLLRPRLGGLGAGSYRFQVAITLPPAPGARRQRPTVIRRDKPFDVNQSRATLGFASPQSLDILNYLATQQEIGEIGRLDGEEARRTYWEAFWKRRDPSPETPENEVRDEFYRRVQYANQQFGVGAPGWKTDMGRVYIIYGRPDEVVRNPFNFDRPPEEMWYYYRDHRTFVFVDRDGFGRYELVGPPDGSSGR